MHKKTTTNISKNSRALSAYLSYLELKVKHCITLTLLSWIKARDQDFW